ncbi:hypothetical protein GCK32_002738 [Trichostrongylus colubriformis]|uniref:Uncharacterized protein n=1 Tax=Trichostrongylus colubriformis TaxID=6319 RepID=A0AAN8IGT2_TRICO
MLRYAARRVLSTATARAVEGSSSTAEYDLRSGLNAEEPIVPNPYLCLFPAPKVVVPNFDLTRRVGTLVSQSIYQLFYEKAYNLERFIHAANEGTSVIGECIANEEWSRMSVVASTDLIERVKIARRRCTVEQLDMLRFHPNDAILSFLHSSFISARNFMTKDETGVLCIYFTIASFIRKSDSVPYEATVTQLLNNYKNDIIVSNVTFARNLSPLGQWKATAVNFFCLDEGGVRQ